MAIFISDSESILTVIFFPCWMDVSMIKGYLLVLAGILPSVSALLFSLLPSLCWWCKHQILKKDETKLKQIFKAHKGGAGHTVDF